METFWLIIRLIAYTFALFVILRVSNNFIFILARMPKTWIAFCSVLGVANMLATYFFKWDVRLVQTAVIFATIFSIPPSRPKGMSKKEHKATIREAFREMGLPYGRLQYRLGLAAFFLFSAATFILFFAEACRFDGSACDRPFLQYLGIE